MSPAGYRFLLRMAAGIDKVLIPRTHGRLSSVGIDKVGLVTTTGAKSGKLRTHALVLIADHDGLLAIGSNYGRPPHPAWTANLLAHPEYTVEFMGPPAQYRAESEKENAQQKKTLPPEKFGKPSADRKDNGVRN